MIPRIIHYCWFGHNPKPRLARKCIKSWKKYCADYDIVEWNEDNFDIQSCPVYVIQAYNEKKWAFVTDYVRLKVVFDNGGIYLDTDVEIINKMDCLLDNTAYFGLETGNYVNTGLGFGAEKGEPFLQELMNDYNSIPFIKGDGGYDTIPCTMRNTRVFINHGLVRQDTEQLLDNRIRIFPTVAFCPLNPFTRTMRRSSESYSIHWFSASWIDKKTKKELRRKQLRAKFNLTGLLAKVLRKVLGKNYSKVRSLFKK